MTPDETFKKENCGYQRHAALESSIPIMARQLKLEADGCRGKTLKSHGPISVQRDDSEMNSEYHPTRSKILGAFDCWSHHVNWLGRK
jgi:hypothetical protein